MRPSCTQISDIEPRLDIKSKWLGELFLLKKYFSQYVETQNPNHLPASILGLLMQLLTLQ